MHSFKHLLGQDGSLRGYMYPKTVHEFPNTAVCSSAKYLWIDCLESDLTPYGLVPNCSDEIIVYRNLAHQISYSDLNFLSVLQYAIQIARINNIIVCGHSDCALLRLSIEQTSADIVETWLSPVKHIYEKYEHQLRRYSQEGLRFEKFCELNVIEQVFRLCQTSVIQNAWKQAKDLTVHGYIYASCQGVFKDLELNIKSEQEIFPAYRRALQKCIEKP